MRKTLAWIAAAFIALPLLSAIVDARRIGGGSGAGTPSITSISYGPAWKYNQYYNGTTNFQTVNGDTWINTWDDLDQIVTMCNDCGFWSTVAGPLPPGGGNFLLSHLTNTAGDTTTIGTLVNDMHQWNGEIIGTPPIPNTHYKVQGIISIAGHYYAMTHRLIDSGPSPPSGDFTDGQMITSSDHGATWSPTPPSGTTAYPNPMFPGLNFPFSFVQYGKDYAGSGPDNSANYVYMTVLMQSPGAQLKLARVAIGNIGDTDYTHVAANWSYWTGGDGMNSANWNASLAAGAPVIGPISDVNGGKAGTGSSMQYLPRYGKYFYIAEQRISASEENWFNYICDHPWGPCAQIGPGVNWNPTGYYLPGIMPKSLVNGGQQLVTTTAGDYNDSGQPTGRYTLTYLPITISP